MTDKPSIYTNQLVTHINVYPESKTTALYRNDNLLRTMFFCV